MSNLAEKEIPIPFNYKPRIYQDPLYVAMMTGRYQRAVIMWHRRSGKEKTCFNIMVDKATERVGTYYYFFPTYAQGKKILWKGIDRDGFKFIDHVPPELIHKTNESDLSIELTNGSIIQVVGTDNYDAVVGTNPIGCVFSEFALQDPQAYALFRPILRENGGWAIFNFTPRGHNHAKDLYDMAESNPKWFCQRLTVADTLRPDCMPVITEGDIQAERDEGMSEELIMQEYYCSFEGSVDGAYFSKQLKKAREAGRITGVPYDEALEVDTWWDLGMDDSMTIYFTQRVGKEIRCIDYLEDSGEGLPYYARELKKKPYNYGKHYMPHDSKVRELGTGKSRKEMAEKLGIKPVIVVKRVSNKWIAIEAARAFFSRMWFDKVKCKDALNGLSNYRKEWDDKKKVFRDRPCHDWASHAADGFMTLAMGFKEIIEKSQKRPPGRGEKLGWMGG